MQLSFLFWQEVFCNLHGEEGNVTRMELLWELNAEGIEIPFVQVDEKCVRLTSGYSPKIQMQFFVQQFDEYVTKSMLYYIFGIGTGDVLNEVEKRMDETSTVIVYEPNQDLFTHIFDKKEFVKYKKDSRFHLLSQKVADDKIYEILQNRESEIGLKPEQILIIDHPNYAYLYPEEKEWFQNQIVEFRIHQEQNRKTMKYYLQEMVETPLTHMEYYKDAVIVEKWKKDWNREIPVILVAAGPSLKKNVNQLKRAKGKAIIIAVDMALSTLHEAGVVPDMIANMDAGVAQSYRNRVEYPEYQNVPLLCNSCTDYDYFYWNKGEKILFRDRPFLQMIKEEAGVSNIGYSYWGSIAIAVFSIFSMLGTKQIVLVGQDLSYGEDGQSHTGGHNEEVMDEPEDIFLPGYYGGEVRSRGDWYGFWKWYEREIPKANYQEVVNATEGGVHIPGTKQKSLEEMVDSWEGKEKSLKSYLKEAKYRVSKEEYETMEKCLEREKQHLLQLDEINKIEYNKRKNEIEKWTIYQLLHDVTLVYDEGDEWERVQRAIGYLKEYGWS